MVNPREAVIVDAVRTPLGKRNGKLKGWHPVDLLAYTLKTLVERNRLDPALIEDVIAGCVMQVGEQGLNIARNAVLAAGFPEKVPGTTVDRQCGSSQQAIHFAAQGVISGAYDVAVACGVESMSRVPLGSSVQSTGQAFGPALLKRYDNGLVHQGLSAEMIARKWGFSRQQLDKFSLQSHQRAAQAIENGYFDGQLVPVPVRLEDGSTGLFTTDEGVRPDTSLEKLAALKPAFTPEGVVTAGNSSQLTDGASALLIMERGKAEQLGLKPRARFVSFAVTGDDPILMLTAPIGATRLALDKAGLSLDQLDLLEINEAFASVVLAWQHETGADWNKVNVNGGAIALGHPLGASGARIMTMLLNELERRGGRYAFQTMCEGGGLANGTIIERL